MIPVFKPKMNIKEILKELEKIFTSGWIGLGPYTKKFEEEFAKYVGSKYAIGVNSCTSALHISLASLNIKEGDEVIIPAMTFASTALSVVYCKAKPVFGDIEEDTLCIDPVDIERKISKKTKCIIPVHYGGHACRMSEIWRIAKSYNLHVIEDAAHACGSEYKGEKIGGLKDTKLTCFSFHAVKNLPCGDGGMITTNDENLYNLLLKLRWLGIDRTTWQRSDYIYQWRYSIKELGFKYHMNDITAIIGLSQLKTLDKDNKIRSELTKKYNELLSELKWIEIPIVKEYCKSAHHNYVIKVPPMCRNKLISYLAEKGISTSVHYEPLYNHKVFKNISDRSKLPITERVWKKIVTLPLYPELTKENIYRIVSAIKEFGKKEKLQ